MYGTEGLVLNEPLLGYFVEGPFSARLSPELQVSSSELAIRRAATARTGVRRSSGNALFTGD